MSKFGVPTDEQLAVINKLAKRNLTADELFVFSGKSAGDMLIPNRYTRISKELLQIMVDDAKKGVSFMLNHNWGSFGVQGIPYGKVFDGELKVSTEQDETVELHLAKYIVRDDEVTDGISANALIKKIETGILSDTSISFSTDTMVCSICGMNYYGGQCSHYRGRTYDMADGTKKLCTVTAMPPSIIIPYNNNALYEESIVWDGAYPGAMVSQAKDGDIIELPTGNFAVLGNKEELPDNTAFLNKYHNGNILTLVKKSDHKKLFNVGEIDEANKKGVKKLMNKKLQKMFKDFDIELKEGENALDEALNQLAEKWETAAPAIKELRDNALAIEQVTAEPLKVAEGTFNANKLSENSLKLLDTFGIKLGEEILNAETKQKESLTVETALNTIAESLVKSSNEVVRVLGKETSTDEVLNLAKEGQDYHKQVVDEAIAMGVRAQGNDFPAETWKATFSTMGTKAIKDIMKTFESQVNSIPTGRQTDPKAGDKQSMSIPDDAFKVGK